MTAKDRERFFGTSDWDKLLKGGRVIIQEDYDMIGKTICFDRKFVYYGFLMVFESLIKHTPRGCSYKL